MPVKTKKRRAVRGMKVSRRLYDALVGSNSTLVRAYAHALNNGGTVDGAQIDRAYDQALRAQRYLLRALRRGR